jgi:hypothetical protein
MNFCSGGVVEGTIGAVSEPSQPPRPPGIPEHYVFDQEVELWMPPSAIKKAAAVAASAPPPGVEVIKSSDPNAARFSAAVSSNEPICFEYTNTGQCGRLARGEACRYRHLEPTHPDVIADKVRQGKLPASALEAARVGDLETLRATMGGGGPGVPNAPQALLPGMTEADLPDPGPAASLCFDYVNNGSCSRLRSGQTCKYRHLPPTHPDVINDKLRHGKITPQMAAQLLSASANPEGAAGAAVSLPSGITANLPAGLGGGMPPGMPPAGMPPGMPPGMLGMPNMLSATADPNAANTPFVDANGIVYPDPGPGFQLCFDFINRATCSRLTRGETCRYRHLPPTHPDVIADKIRQGKAPGAMPNQPMGNYVATLAQMGASMHGYAGQPPAMMGQPPAMLAMMNASAGTGAGASAASGEEKERARDGSPGSDAGEKYRNRDRDRERRVDRRRDYDRRDYDRRDYDRRDRRDYEYDRRNRRDYDRRSDRYGDRDRDRDRRDRDRDRRERDRRRYSYSPDRRRDHDRRGSPRDRGSPERRRSGSRSQGRSPDPRGDPRAPGAGREPPAAPPEGGAEGAPAAPAAPAAPE